MAITATWLPLLPTPLTQEPYLPEVPSLTLGALPYRLLPLSPLLSLTPAQLWPIGISLKGQGYRYRVTFYLSITTHSLKPALP